MFYETDYSEFNNNEFMDLDHAKSITVNLNIAEWAFKNRANNFAVVTGLGFSLMDFAFDDPITIKKENGRIAPVPLDPNGLKKSKLNVTYLTVPLMLEVKTPLKLNGSKLYLAAGVIGGLHLGSHSKYKYKNDKFKDKSSFNVRDFKLDLTGRIGFGDFCIFANMGLQSMFEGNKGPMLMPLTVGVSFPNI
jgi:hypothetical protein